MQEVRKPSSRVNQQKPTRILPHSDESERAVLGAILLDNNCLPVVQDILRREDWNKERHALLWDGVLALAGAFEHIDTLTLLNELTRTGRADAVGGATYISSLTDGVPADLSLVKNWAEIIKEKSQLRKVYNLAVNTASKSLAGAAASQSVIEDAVASYTALSRSLEGTGLIKIDRIAKDMDWQTFVDHKASQGLYTGFYDVDAMTQGLHQKELTLIAARPSCGKSAISINIAQNVAKDGAKVAIFSLEMSRQSLLVRMICSEGRLDHHRIRSGFCTQTDIATIAHSVSSVVSLPLWIDDTSSLSVAQLRSRAWRQRQEFGLDLLIVDYLQLLSSGLEARNGRYNRAEEIGVISRTLKGIAKDFSIPVIACAQLNREPEKGRKKREPQLSDLRESGELEQNADTVFFLHPDDQEPSDTRTISIICGKQRNGPQARGKLTYLAPYTKFENYAGYERTEA